MESNANFSSVNNVLKYINEKHPVLPKYLTSDDLVDLESIILSELQNSSGVASGFREILFNFGWNGLHFRTAHGNTINLQNFVDSLTNELLNIYREGVSESGSYYSQYGSSSGKNSAKEPSISFSNKGFGRQRPHHGVGSFSASVGASSRNGAHRAPSFMERMGGGDLALDLERSREDNLTLLSYCPDILFECNSNFEEPVSVSFKGACVLIDISGFTKLSNSLCQKGSNGLDRLHSATDVYLGYFSDTVYQYGGDGK